jgi:hypothetical protein
VGEWSVSGFSEVRELGRGAQGRVVLARHATAGTPVAIKYLPADAAEGDRALFEREARLLGQVRHPNVARLYRLVMGERGAAIIMEAVDGVPLRRILAEHGALGPEASLLVLKGSLLGLAAAHRAGVVHRDYKPANVVVRGDGLSKLIDFGVAVWSGQGSRAGTPYYMAPEQWRGDPATPATDVYAATCVFYECVTGRRPYDPADRVALMGQHLTGPIPVAEAPEPLRPLIARGLAKAPAERPPGAAAFVGADWEHRAVRALAAAATAFAALFPLTAAGLAPAAPGTATAAPPASGGESALQHGAAKATSAKSLAAVSAAVVGVAAVGVAVYALRDSNDPPGRPAAGSATSTSPRPSLSGVPLRVGDLTITAPATWKVRAIRGYDGSTTNPRQIDTGHRVNVPGRCVGPRTGPFAESSYTDNCPGFAVLRSQWIDPRDDNVGYTPSGPFNPGTDIAAFCPRDPEKYSVAKPVSVQKQAQVTIGGRAAQYKEWRMECYGGADGTQKSGVYFTQRLWYLAAQKLLIVDEFDTPNLTAILDQARWTR